MDAELQKQFRGLQALVLTQSADVSALIALYSSIREALKDAAPELPTIERDFLALRKKFLHIQLEQLENSNPELAARLQEVIDSSSTNFPFDY